jgi:hypothetical protein
MREGVAEVGPVDVKWLPVRNVHILAARAVHFNARGRKLLRYANRQHVLPLAEYTRTGAKLAQQVLFFHHIEAARRKYKPHVD